MAEPKIKYDIEANVSGDAEVGALASKMEALAATMEVDLKTSALSAAAALRELGSKNDAATAFFELKQKAQAAAAALAEAQLKAQALAREIAASGAPTRTQAGQMAKLGDAVGAAKREVLASTQALEAGRGSLAQYGLSTDGLAKSQAAMKSELGLAKIQAQGMTGQYGTLAGGAKSAAVASEQAAKGTRGVGSAAESASGMLRAMIPLMATAFSANQFLGAITSSESLNRSYAQLFGSTARAREEMEFIRTTANRLGLETLDLAKSYQSLSASTKGTVLEGQATRDIFEAVTRAMSNLGKTSAETERALNAISQMASKGTVSMEELRQQLGESLPGAMKAAADGAGVTVEQLTDMVSTGSVLAKDLLPALTKGLNDLYGKAAPPQTVISEWARFKNVITDTSIAIGEGGASKGIARGLAATAEAAKYAALGVDILGTAIGEGAAALVTLDGSLTTSQDLAKKYGIATVAEAEALDKATAAQGGLNAAQKAAGGTAQELIRHMELLAQKTIETVFQVKERYLELTKGSADYVAQINKEAAARTAEGAVLTQLVGIYGTEIEKRQVAVAVAQTQAAVAEKLASAQNTGALIAASYVLKLQEQAAATGDVTEATKKQIDAAQKVAAAMQTEFERTQALAQARRIEAEASKAQAQATQDNAARVTEYAGAMQAAKTHLEALILAHQRGKATEQEVSEGRAKLAAATLLYRDALADATKAAELNIATQQRAGQLAQASISVDAERVKAAIEVANAQGDGAKAARLATEATALQVQASQAQADASRNEATAIRTAADAKEAELKATGELTASAKEGIAAQRQSADLKDLEAQKSDILTQKLQALARANNSVTGSLESQNAAQERANAATEKAIELENKRRGVDKEGFATDKSGNRIVMGGDLTTRTGIYNFLKSAGVTDDAAAKKITNEFSDNNGNIPYLGNPGQIKYGGQFDTISKALLKAAEQFTFSAKNSGANTTPTIGPGSLNTTVNINLGGVSSAIHTDDAGARALQDLMGRLAAAKGTAA